MRARPRSASALVGLFIAAGAIAPSVAAESSHSLVALAVAHEHGEGVPKDPLKAAALYCEAARDGDVEAQYGLGWMYAMGRGVRRDDAVAGTLLAMAAASGHAEAAKALRFVGDERAPPPECMAKPEPPPPESEPPAPDPGPDPFADLPAWKRQIADIVASLAPRYEIDPRLALTVIQVESNFEPRAVSEKNARGLMQLIPETAARFNVKNVFDPRDNVRGGLAYLRWLLAYYEGRVALVAAAYNAGEAIVDRYGGIPPYPETRDYVRRVQRLFRSEGHPFDPRVVAPSPIVVGIGATTR